MTAAILVWWSMIRMRHDALLEMPASTTLDGGFLDFRDPWGNRIEIVGYDNIQFTKAQNVLRGMGLQQLTKNEKAKQELAKKGMA
jgi:lactoylglutathione lyase